MTLSTYEFLISYPDAANPNKIHLYDDQNKKVRLLLLTSFFVRISATVHSNLFYDFTYRDSMVQIIPPYDHVEDFLSLPLVMKGIAEDKGKRRCRH